MYNKKVSKHLWALQFMHFFTCVAQFYAQTERHSSFEILKNCLKLILIIHKVNMFPWDIFGIHSLDRRYVTESVMEYLKKTYDSKLDIYNRITVCQLPLYDTSELRNVVTANLVVSPFSIQFRSGLVINKL